MLVNVLGDHKSKVLGVLYSNIDMPFILVKGNANSLTILCSK